MKKLFLLILLLLIVSSARVSAATQEWQIQVGSNYVLQTCADGSGGVAMIYGGGSTNFALIWLDKKGNTIFQDTLNSYSYGGILGCTKKDLIFVDVDLETNLFVYHVNSDGQKEIVPADPNTFNGQSSLVLSFLSKTSDTKGFFVTVTDTNNWQTSFVRYRNK